MGRVKKNICRHCKKETGKEGNPYWPFCSERCKIIDLGKWASGHYAIPGEPVRKEKEEEEEEK